MKIVVVALGYVGLLSAVLLAQHNEVIGVDVSRDRVDAVNARKSPIIDEFKRGVDIILANRMVPELQDFAEKVFTRDLFGAD